jgi:glycosyltransferase involved in cell wall biosynthesis
VAIVSCNHERFIARALESVFKQKTNFKFEVIACDDASQDGTGKVLDEFLKKYSANFTVIRNERSLGPAACGRLVSNKAKGDYFAWLDADDYWLYEHKLQKQVLFLESHPDYSGCFHDAVIESTVTSEDSARAARQSFSGMKYYSQLYRYKPDFFPWDLLERNLLPTASLVFRKTCLNPFFDKFQNTFLSLNWALHLYIIRNSKFRFINEAWSVYNDHAGGISKKKSAVDFHLSDIEMLKVYRKDSFYRKYKIDLLKTVIREYYYILTSPEKKFNRSFYFLVLCRMNWWKVKLFARETNYFLSCIIRF